MYTIIVRAFLFIPVFFSALSLPAQVKLVTQTHITGLDTVLAEQTYYLPGSKPSRKTVYVYNGEGIHHKNMTDYLYTDTMDTEVHYDQYTRDSIYEYAIVTYKNKGIISRQVYMEKPGRSTIVYTYQKNGHDSVVTKTFLLYTGDSIVHRHTYTDTLLTGYTITKNGKLTDPGPELKYNTQNRLVYRRYTDPVFKTTTITQYTYNPKGLLTKEVALRTFDDGQTNTLTILYDAQENPVSSINVNSRSSLANSSIYYTYQYKDKKILKKTEDNGSSVMVTEYQYYP